ncbi:glycosyltransferase [Streptomyces boluensis]|uniref:4,4'-diaponeurosporenoate glycosyltransferase n=1 Tax=Streptomyces boluensis TaxID=1775135 RepID=A0A964UIQ9_9ACTN|nr:glycosyltransferase [Streptomyces boluensis]NBE49893.1 glycosyltransferase [Streptomyces boluensis]
MTALGLTVVIPAHNEVAYLPRYLPTVLASLARWQETSGEQGEVIVVDNASTDATADMAATFGVRVIRENVRNIGRVRNSGAAAARGRRLFFTDADVALPLEAITTAADAMDSGAVGGAIPPLYTPKRLGARLLCAYWDHYRTRHGGAQGVAQFATGAAFKEVGGYRDDLFMSEDVEFFARLRAHGRATAAPVEVLDDLRVRPSTRRYDEWSILRMLWWQNPVTARLRLSSPRMWRHWYETTVR